MDKEKLLKEIYPVRREGAYNPKYSYGLVLVIGGGQFYSGSPALSAMAALRTGADMVRVFSPKRSADIIASYSPSLAAYPLNGNWLTEEHLPLLIGQTESAEEVSGGNLCVVIGGGSGRSEETKKAIRGYLEKVDVPVVVDADAIHALEGKPETVRGKNFLLTPHSYEFFILTGVETDEMTHEQKQEVVKEHAKRLDSTLLFKEKPDIISDGKKVVLTRMGTPYMSVGGTGDSLAGVCGALIARGVSPLKAAEAGTFILGSAGRMSAEVLRDGLLPTDIIEFIPEVIKGYV